MKVRVVMEVVDGDSGCGPPPLQRDVFVGALPRVGDFIDFGTEDLENERSVLIVTHAMHPNRTPRGVVAEVWLQPLLSRNDKDERAEETHRLEVEGWKPR